MNKKTLGSTIFIFFFLFLVLFLVSSFVIKWRSDVSQNQGDSLIELLGERTIGQTFVANKNNLGRITIDLKNAALENKKPIYFHLKEQGSEEDLRTIEINGFNIGDPSSVRFEFSPISDSSGKRYYFYLESTQSIESNAIEVYYSQNDLYTNGEMIIDGQASSGDVRFTSFYLPESKKQVFRETINSFISHFFADKAFAYFYIALLILTLSVFLKKK